MINKTLGLFSVLLGVALLGSACQEAAPTPTSPAPTPTQPAPTATTRPTATAVGLPPPTAQIAATPSHDLPEAALAPGWTTFPITRPVTALAQAANGAIWVGQEEGGFRFPAAAAETLWTRLGGEMAEASINSFFPLPTGIWVGHDDGASFFAHESEAWTHLRPGPAPSAGLYRSDVQAITADGNGRLWFGTSGGVTVWDGQRFFYDDFLTDEARFAGRRPFPDSVHRRRQRARDYDSGRGDLAGAGRRPAAARSGWPVAGS